MERQPSVQGIKPGPSDLESSALSTKPSLQTKTCSPFLLTFYLHFLRPVAGSTPPGTYYIMIRYHDPTAPLTPSPPLALSSLQSLHVECGVLRDALSEFSRWVRSKLSTIEEDMDIFKVIYSLHGSLSQVRSVCTNAERGTTFSIMT